MRKMFCDLCNAEKSEMLEWCHACLLKTLREALEKLP